MRKRILFGVGILAALAACDRAQTARNIPASVGSVDLTQRTTLKPRYDIRQIAVTVPESLPAVDVAVPDPLLSDIAAIDRPQQIKALMQAAFAQATTDMTSGPDVRVDAELGRFNPDVSGYSIRLQLTVTNLRTGKILEGPRPVFADMPAATVPETPAEARLRATRHLRDIIAAELSEQRREEAPASRNLKIPLTPERIMSQTPIPL